MKKQETFDEMKVRIRYANQLLDDLQQLDKMIDFIDAYGGEENYDHPMQLELRARFYPDDCITDPNVEIREDCYEDKTFSLATLMGPHLSGVLSDCRQLLLGKIEQAAKGRINDQE